MATTPAVEQPVTLVTQTRVLPDHEAEFSGWQQRTNDAAAAFPGFLDHTVTPPSPPAQVDWVIVQRFQTMEAAQAWLRSAERQRLVKEIEPALAGPDDIHLFREGAAPPADAHVSAVISMRVAPGSEQQFRAWQRRIATAEAAFPGFQGAKLEPPIPGVQEDWATIVRFDSDEHLQAWLNSPQRQALLAEATAFGAECHVRTMRGGFDGWFTFGEGPSATAPPAWKQNMVVLLVLYPVVFLFGKWVGTPLLTDRGVPFWLSLFIANAVSTVLLGYLLVPRVSRALRWWLAPPPDAGPRSTVTGIALILALYGILLALFSRFP